MGILALLALMLITVSFRESESGPLHEAQEAASTALHPFQVTVERVARPFRDAYGWASGLFDARAEAERLRRENQVLLEQVVQNESALQENVELRALLDYANGPEFPEDYDYQAAEVLSRAPGAFQQVIVVSAGANQGVRLDTPVITNDGLAGKVTRVFSRTARVTLITDPQSSVAAIDLRTGAGGIVEHGSGSGDTLVLDRVTKNEFVRRGDEIVTAGSTSTDFESLYPRGIRIGRVTSVGQTDTDYYQQVQVEPFVDLSGLSSVLVLIPKEPADAP